VALLFFLQPIVRGWARYHWRLTVHSEPPILKRPFSREQIDELETLEKVSYWSESGSDRYTFLNQILAKLKAEGWQYKTDTGWSDHDVEIFGSRWSRLRLATVTEELGEGKRIFRGRLNPTWSLPACIFFWFICGTELLVIGFLGSTHPWIWLLLASLSVFGLWLDHEKRDLMLRIAALLDEVAQQQNLLRLPPSVRRSQPPSDTSTEGVRPALVKENR
jgi:hypothetical protein